MTSREMEDEIIRLRKLAPEGAALEAVEEAAHALAEGREMEAEALVEKVAAMLRQGLEVTT